MEKINFSGGEPFLPEKGQHLGKMVKYCKEVLKLESVTIVSNGSLITKKWFENYGKYLDILAISCDSFDEETNEVCSIINFEKYKVKYNIQHCRKLVEDKEPKITSLNCIK